MIRLALFLLLLSAGWSTAQKPTLLFVVGAPGNEEYLELFDEQTATWKSTAGKTFDFHTLTNKVDLQAAIADVPSELWIVLLGHGTFDGKHARFNLRGPDLSPDELNTWLEPVTNNCVIVNCSAASALFLKTLAAKNRTVVTATRSGSETSFSHFGTYLTQAFSEVEAADLDKDHALSALEVFLYASRRVEEFYAADGRIQTETALIDDNGDGKGTQANWFIGSRPDPSRIKKGSPDGYRAIQQVLLGSKQADGLNADQREQRDALEQELFILRERREELGDEAYFRQLEEILLKLGVFYQRP